MEDKIPTVDSEEKQVYSRMNSSSHYFNPIRSFWGSLFSFLSFIAIVYQCYVMTQQTGVMTQQTGVMTQQEKLMAGQNKRLDQQVYLQEAERRGSIVFLFNNVMDAVDKEIKNDHNKDGLRNLSRQLIGRIISLSYMLKPYKWLEGDSLINESLSPERGMLLVNLIYSRLDTTTYNLIWNDSNFEKADLRGVRITNAYLRGINLKGADCSKAIIIRNNLEEACLNEANLEGVNFTYSNLTAAALSYSNMHGVDLSVTNLYNARLRNTVLCEVKGVPSNCEVGDLKDAIVSDSLFLNKMCSVQAKKYVVKKSKKKCGFIIKIISY